MEFEGKRVLRAGENTIAVFSINQETGEPILIQSADTRGIFPRTFAVDASGGASLPSPTRIQWPCGGIERQHRTRAADSVPDRRNGKLVFAHQYDFQTGGSVSLFWTGIVSLP